MHIAVTPMYSLLLLYLYSVLVFELHVSHPRLALHAMECK